MFDGIKKFVIYACPHYILDACCFHIVLIAECDQDSLESLIGHTPKSVWIYGLVGLCV
jgi:hypothetical protein